MNIKRATALALSLSLLLGAAACGKSDSEAADTGSKTSAELLEEENAILDAHQKLWDQVFASMDKSSPATTKNYGDVLLSALENCRDSLSDGDYQTLKSDAESIRSIEEQIAALPADDSAGQSETAAASAFPEFTGKDLDGNAVDSSLFANNAYTVVNFWFSGCKPCVAELGELDKLNQTREAAGRRGDRHQYRNARRQRRCHQPPQRRSCKSKGATYQQYLFRFLRATAGDVRPRHHGLPDDLCVRPERKRHRR